MATPRNGGSKERNSGRSVLARGNGLEGQAWRLFEDLEDQAGYVDLGDLVDKAEELTREARGLASLILDAAGHEENEDRQEMLSFIAGTMVRLMEELSKKIEKYHSSAKTLPIAKVLKQARSDCVGGYSRFLKEWAPVLKEGWCLPKCLDPDVLEPMPAALERVGLAAGETAR